MKSLYICLNADENKVQFSTLGANELILILDDFRRKSGLRL